MKKILPFVFLALLGVSACTLDEAKEKAKEVATKLEETGVKTYCESRTTQDTCSIDTSCQWDETVCKDR